MEAYADDTVLTDVLGNHPKTKILIALIAEADQDLNPSDIAHLAGINRGTVYQHIDDLVAYDLVVQTRQVGNSQLYQINRESPVEDLAKLEWGLVEFLAEREQHGDRPVDKHGRPTLQ